MRYVGFQLGSSSNRDSGNMVAAELTSGRVSITSYLEINRVVSGRFAIRAIASEDREPIGH